MSPALTNLAHQGSPELFGAPDNCLSHVIEEGKEVGVLRELVETRGEMVILAS
jgi:hypothetical protein